MMMGHGLGGSNLSASAPPFTVDRSLPKPVSNPLLDLTDPPAYAAATALNPSFRSWASSYSPNSMPDYFSIPSHEFESSNAYTCSPSAVHAPPLKPPVSASPDALFYAHAQTSASLAEAKPYYPSYVSPTISDDPSSVVPQHSGYDLLSTSHVATITNGFPHANYTPGSSGLEKTALSGDLWEGRAHWQHTKLPQLDGSFCSKEAQGFYVSNTTSKYEEPSNGIAVVGGEMLPEPASTGKFDYKSFGSENPKFMPSDYPTASTLASASVVPETYPQVPISKAVNSWNHQIPCSASYEKCSRKLDTLPSASTSVMKPSSAVVIRPPGQDKIDNSTRDGDDKGFAANNPSVVKEPLTHISSEGENKQVAEHLLDLLFMAKAESQFPCTYLDCLSLAVDNSGAIDSGENCSDSLDQHNPAVDSPCWKGAPVSRLSPFEFCEVVTPQDLKRLDACNGPKHQGPQILPLAPNDAITVSAEKLNEHPLEHDNGFPENDSALSLNRSSVESVLFGEENDVVKHGAHITQPSYGQGVQISNGIHEPRKENAMPNKSINCSGFKPPEKNYASGIVFSDVAIGDDPDECSSHVPFCAIEHVLSSPPSVEDAAAKLINSLGEKSTPRMYAHTLLNTILNLSELLLFHCSNNSCGLKEEDCAVLNGVINNLNACVFKNAERMVPMHEFSIPLGDTSRCIGNLPKLHKGPIMHRPQISTDHAVNFRNQHVQHDKAYIKKDEKLSNSVRGAADGMKDDNMTQAIKKVLSENFQVEEETQPFLLLYKNLWLEAEASLCAINYVSRFNRMKSEMEKLNFREANVFPEKSGIKDILSSKVSSDIFTANELTACDKGGAASCISSPGSSTLGTSSHADDVLGRFHMLKWQVDHSNSVDTSAVEKSSGSKVSPAVNKVDKLAHKLKDGCIVDVSNLDSSLSSTRKYDVETSLRARLQILPHQNDPPISMDVGKHLSGCASGYRERTTHWSPGKDGLGDKIFYSNTEPVSRNPGANSSEDKSTGQESHLFVKEDTMTKSQMINRTWNQPHTGWYDSSSSDWEHVLKEETAGQTC